VASIYPRTFLKTRMPSCPNLRPDMAHRVASAYLAPIGKEKVHLNLANLIKGGGEGRENLVGDVCDREGFDDILACSFLQVFQIEFWMTPIELGQLAPLRIGGGWAHCQPIDRPPSHCKAMAVHGWPIPTRGSTGPSRSAGDHSHPMQGQAEISDVHHLQRLRRCSLRSCSQWAVGRTAHVRRRVYCPVNRGR
jgi:hypothetical protein